MCSIAHFVNSKGQVVGTSGCTSEEFEVHGFLRQPGGSIIDLNDFVPPGSNLRVTSGETINDRGEIAGSGELPNGDFHAIVLIPCDDAHGGDTEGCQDADQNATSIESAFATPNVSGAAEGGATKTSDSMPNLLDSLDADRIRFSTTLSCTHYGWPCSPSYPRCCGTLRCVFIGGGTRAGYSCR